MVQSQKSLAVNFVDQQQFKEKRKKICCIILQFDVFKAVLGDIVVAGAWAISLQMPFSLKNV